MSNGENVETKGFATRLANPSAFLFVGALLAAPALALAPDLRCHPERGRLLTDEGSAVCFVTPHGSRELSGELVVWYYPPGRHVNAKNNKNGFATRPATNTRFY